MQNWNQGSSCSNGTPDKNAMDIARLVIAKFIVPTQDKVQDFCVKKDKPTHRQVFDAVMNLFAGNRSKELLSENIKTAQVYVFHFCWLITITLTFISVSDNWTVVKLYGYLSAYD